MLQYSMDCAKRIYSCCLLLALCSSIAAQGADLSAPDTPNYAHSSQMTRLLHWPHFPVRLYFSATPYATAERRTLALSGFDEWGRATQGVVCYQIVSDPAQADITVTIASSVDVPKEARALGQTTLTYTGTLLSKAMVQLVVRDDEPAEFQEICAHEFGHALGLNGHSDDPDDMMFPVLSHSLFQVKNDELDCLCSPGSVTTRDVNTLKIAYPALAFPAKNR